MALNKINYPLPNIFSIFIYPYRYKQAGCYFELENQEEIHEDQPYLLIASRENVNEHSRTTCLCGQE